MKDVSRLIALAAVAMTAQVVPYGPAGAATGDKPAKAAAKGKSEEKTPKKAVCLVCAAKTGKQELEPVKATLKYKGKMYYFCEDKDKAEFISNPGKYAK